MQPSAEEYSSNALSAESLQLAVDQVRMNGFVLFESAIPAPTITRVRDAFMQTLEEHRSRNPSNRGSHRYQMHLPFRAPFIDPLVIEHPFVLAVLDTILGETCHCHYFASDTALPGSDYQGVHSDTHLLFPETSLALPAYSIVVNIPLVDVTLERGPVEIWPGGTHLMPGAMDIQRTAQHMHSELVTMPAGSLLIRDMRMWHRGTPNRSDVVRPHLAMIFSRFWYRETGYPPIEIDRAVYDGLSPRARQLFRFERISR